MSTTANAGSWKTESVGGFSKVHIYTPDTTSPIGDGKSLMINLHGCAQEASVLKGANFEDAAEQYGMVIALPDAQYKEGFACWGYWTGGINRNSKDYKNVISLAQTLSADSARDIDANQVYVSGLSSGGAFAMTVGCLAPDIFAGMGLDAAPSAGTSSSGAVGGQESNPKQTASRCESYAGVHRPYFETQLTSTAFGTSDHTVSQGYAEQNAEAMAIVYGVSKEDSSDIGDGATETLYTDNRITKVEMEGVDHAWPSGPGGTGQFVSSKSINYGVYLAKYFAENNMRVNPPNPDAPELIGLTGTGKESGELTISGTAIAKDGTRISTVTVEVDGEIQEAGNAGDFTAKFTVKPGYKYVAKVIVTAKYLNSSNGEELVEKGSVSVEVGEQAPDAPAWCASIPESSYAYLPQCKPKPKYEEPTKPSWCEYLSESTRQLVSACAD